MEYTRSRIFLRTLGEQPAPDEWAIPRSRLRHALLGFREKAAVLAGEIHRPDEIPLVSFSPVYNKIADKRVRLHPHVLGVYDVRGQRHVRTVQDWIEAALAQAWGCDLDEIEVVSDDEPYEIGIRKGIPEGDLGVTVLRRPFRPGV